MKFQKTFCVRKIFDHFPKYDMKILFGNFNAKLPSRPRIPLSASSESCLKYGII